MGLETLLAALLRRNKRGLARSDKGKRASRLRCRKPLCRCNVKWISSAIDLAATTING